MANSTSTTDFGLKNQDPKDMIVKMSALWRIKPIS